MKSPSARTSIIVSIVILIASIVTTVVILLPHDEVDSSSSSSSSSSETSTSQQSQKQQEASKKDRSSIHGVTEASSSAYDGDGLIGRENGDFGAASSPVLAPSSTPPTRSPTFDVMTAHITSAPAISTDIPTLTPTQAPTFVPTSHPASNSPTPAPMAPFLITGSLVNHPDIGLKVAAGLTVRVVAQSDQRVEFTSSTATRSHSGRCKFHVRPDGAATFDAGAHNGDWYYCSNSEVKEYQNSAYNRCNGNMQSGKCRAGVYCLLFDKEGNGKDYQHRLGGDDMCGHNDGRGPSLPSTSTNCQGCVTPWHTYVSCEETGSGYCWQVDPRGVQSPQRIEALGMSKPGEDKGGWEAMTVDTYTNPSCPTFFFSEDSVNGKIWRLRPDCGSDSDGDEMAQYEGWDMLHKGNTVVDYLEFIGGCEEDGSTSKGNFRWTRNKSAAGESARSCYPYAEGITTTRGKIFFVTKASDLIFTLDQATGRWQGIHSHANELLYGDGNFQRWPDQISVQNDDFMFLTTDGSSTPGVYVHNIPSGKYYTLWQSKNIGKGREESVGHAISPDGRFAVGALQKDGRVFLFAREDGETFTGFNFALRRR